MRDGDLAINPFFRLPERLRTAWKAAWQLGPGPVVLNGVYRLGMRSGHLRRVTPPTTEERAYPLRLSALLPDGFATQYRAWAAQYPALTAEAQREADEIIGGEVRLFGSEPVELALAPRAPLAHWTAYEGRGEDGADIKLTWEPARFGWALTLARAYLLRNDDAYAQCFWQNLETFLDANPNNLGPNWASAQEVALRLISATLAASAMQESVESTPARLELLARAVAQHAQRIPPTLLYARSQGNNHLLTEAAGLLTAGMLLPDHPRAGEWARLGWTWLERGLCEQIGADGTYAQHSANYHRLMLQTALWGQRVGAALGLEYRPEAHARLANAVEWLLARMDYASGHCLNLGSNDGAYILPLAPGGYCDYRPVAQAAARAFLNRPAFPPGAWDEFGLWLGLVLVDQPTLPQPAESTILRGAETWASLRAVHFAGRPSQADQLHVDVWWRGAYIARDAGTFRYTAPAPWENALARTEAHNTLTLDGRDQMLRAGKFLWLDWAQARVLASAPGKFVEAEHGGYRGQGVTHRRRLELAPNGWLVTDHMVGAGEHSAVLHWLLPDWPWMLDGRRLALVGPAGRVTLELGLDGGNVQTWGMQLIRCGEMLFGEDDYPSTLGWYSPTYQQKLPALSLRLGARGLLPIQFTSRFTFYDEV